MVVEVPDGYRAGAWEVVEPIASGSWASVYAARRAGSRRAPDAALKFLPSGSLSAPQFADLRDAVADEVRFSEQADHPGLIRTFETFVVDDPASPELDGAVVLAMERAETSVHDVLATVSRPEAERIVAEICAALAHMHASGWLHGDLKPRNVLLMADGSVRLADFGLARELDGTHAYAPRLGSSDYLPPEWWSERISEQGVAIRTTADVWALGVTAHQLLTGGLLPFPGATARARGGASQAYAAGGERLRLADELPVQWQPIVADCLAPDHAARLPHTAASVLARVEALREGDGGPRTPGGRGARGGESAARGAGAAGGRRVGAAAGGRGAARGARGWLRPAGLGLAVAAVAAGALALFGSSPARDSVPLRVFNAEASCRHSLSPDCRLGLAGDPHARYGPANVVARVRHGDVLAAECFVDDGTRVRSEDGRSSTRWYRVRRHDSEAPPSGEAWLPGVRAWPGAAPAIGRCAS